LETTLIGNPIMCARGISGRICTYKAIIAYKEIETIEKPMIETSETVFKSY
jgi:hypothetical protein